MKKTHSLNREELLSRLKSAGIAYLSNSYKTEKEVRTKLGKYLDQLTLIYEFAPDVQKNTLIDDVIESFNQSGLLDEGEYIRMYVKSAVSKPSPKSPLEIKRFLLAKGINSEKVTYCLNKYYSPKENEVIRKIVLKKHKMESPKLVKYLLNKGFSYSSIQTVMADFFS